MAASPVDFAHPPFITPTPIPFLFGRQEFQSSGKSFSYPGCRSEPSGPCGLQERSSEACDREFSNGLGDLWKRRYCMCTNGYFERSSECWIDCRYGTRFPADPASISRESRKVSIDCESYLLAIESDAAVSSSLLNKQNSSTTSKQSSSTRSGARQGATATSEFPVETINWVERPSSTGTTQSNAANSMFEASRYASIPIVATFIFWASFILFRTLFLPI